MPEVCSRPDPGRYIMEYPLGGNFVICTPFWCPLPKAFTLLAGYARITSTIPPPGVPVTRFEGGHRSSWFAYRLFRYLRNRLVHVYNLQRRWKERYGL